jgi:hypothetical protein
MNIQEETCNAVAESYQPPMDILSEDAVWRALLSRMKLPASSIDVMDVLGGMLQDVTDLELMYNL